MQREPLSHSGPPVGSPVAHTHNAQRSQWCPVPPACTGSWARCVWAGRLAVGPGRDGRAHQHASRMQLANEGCGPVGSPWGPAGMDAPRSRHTRVTSQISTAHLACTHGRMHIGSCTCTCTCTSVHAHAHAHRLMPITRTSAHLLRCSPLNLFLACVWLLSLSHAADATKHPAA